MVTVMDISFQTMLIESTITEDVIDNEETIGIDVIDDEETIDVDVSDDEGNIDVDVKVGSNEAEDSNTFDERKT